MTTITLPRAVVEQALQALENAEDHLAKPYSTDASKAITALKAALAQEQPNPPGCDHCNHPLYAATKCRVCGRVTEQAEPVEPVAKVELMTTGGNAGLATRIVEIDDHLRERLRPGQLLYTAPPQRKPLPQLAEAQCPHPEGHPRLRDAWLDGWEAAERAHGIGGQE